VCIIQNEGLIRKIYIPKLVFPLTRVLINLVTLLLSLGAMFLLLFPLGARLAWPLLFLPAAIGIFLVFTLGLGLVVATANTFYRDCGHFVSVFLQAWYFVTPILYFSSDFPPTAQWRFRLNPAYYFIELFHEILYLGRWPAVGSVLGAILLALVSLGIGYVTFKSHEDKMVFRL
jgi:ABC-type polysaccharide/polyol phosphate export permease